MRDQRPGLILLVALGLCVFYGALFGLTVNALADESASPAPSPTFVLPTPSPTPTASEPVNRHLWAKHWAKQAAKNRRPLKALAVGLDRTIPPMPQRPKASASDRRWNRYGCACRDRAVLYVKLHRQWKKLLKDPVTLGRYLAAKRGWTGAQWTALYRLWSAESGWRVHAANPTSSAYGIPQALPGSKMGPGWQHSALVQIRWGLRYIAGRYGTPAAAYAHLCGCGWY